jgi:hypothetical protein
MAAGCQADLVLVDGETTWLPIQVGKRLHHDDAGLRLGRIFLTRASSYYMYLYMFSFSNILRDLQAVIAAKAARERALTVLLVALWGRIARMGTRLERLVALWRAGKSSQKARAPRNGVALVRTPSVRVKFPNGAGWLTRKLGYEVAAFGGQLQHLLTDAECKAFLAAMPQARRILRPLLRMLLIDPLPEVVRLPPKPVMQAVAQVVDRVGAVAAPVGKFFFA